MNSAIIHSKLNDQGLIVPNFNTLVTVSTLKVLEYDEMRDEVFKVYNEETITLPFNTCMRKRTTAHPLNMDEMVNSFHGRIKLKAPAICFN